MMLDVLATIMFACLLFYCLQVEQNLVTICDYAMMIVMIRSR